MRSISPASTRHARVSHRSLVLGTCLVAVALLIGAATAAWGLLLPQVETRTPSVGTTSERPTAVLYLRNARGLQESHVRATFDGRDVSDRVSVARDTVVVRLPRADEGRHTVRVSTDRFGLLRERVDERWSFRVDTTAPKLSLSQPPQAKVRSAERDVRFAARTEPGAQLTLRAGPIVQTVAAGEDGRADAVLRLRQGHQRVRVEARDEIGNVTRTTRRVFVDSVAPRVKLIVPERTDTRELQATTVASDATALELQATVDGLDDGTRFSAATPGSASDRGGMFALLVDEPLAEGLHRIEVTATDRMGHTTTVAGKVLVDSSESLGENALGLGARGNDVRQLHLRLQKLKLFDPAQAAREWRLKRYGPQTASSIMAFQKDRELDQDGLAGTETLAALTLRIVIDRANHTLTLYRLDRVERTYGVAVGSPRYPTPAGSFRIVDKQRDPTWTPPPDSDWAKGKKPIPPGPDNPLGTRWMGIDASAVGIHGTNSPASIGYSVSHGCIRMAIPDVEELFERVQLGTPVHIV